MNPSIDPTDGATRDALARSPKVLLHEHLDGGLRTSTLLELLRERGQAAPASDAAALGRWFDERAHSGSLERYLEGFSLTVPAMADPHALHRVAFEAAEDALADGVVLAEFRIAPLLFEAFGLDGDTAVEAMVSGLRRSGLPSGLIVCAMRQEDEAQTRRAADLALRWSGRGVVGFDLAGPERGFDPSRHARALALVREAGLPITLHAGEADAGERVLQAARLGARRIGHGVRLAELLDGPRRSAVLAEVLQRDLHLEVCPTSNLHTAAVAAIAEHPIAGLWQAGVSLSVNTDNRLMSRVTLGDEFHTVLAHTPLGPVDLLAMTLEAARHSFLAAPERERARDAVWAHAQRTGATGALTALLRERGLPGPPAGRPPAA